MKTPIKVPIQKRVTRVIVYTVIDLFIWLLMCLFLIGVGVYEAGKMLYNFFYAYTPEEKAQREKDEYYGRI